jgi:hypothetical protein
MILTRALREVGHILVRPLLPHIVVQCVYQASKPTATHNSDPRLRESGWQRRAEELDRLDGLFELRVDHFVVSFEQRVSDVVEGVVEVGSVVQKVHNLTRFSPAKEDNTVLGGVASIALGGAEQTPRARSVWPRDQGFHSSV